MTVCFMTQCFSNRQVLGDLPEHIGDLPEHGRADLSLRMHRVQRLASFFVVVLFAVSSLTGCQAEGESAAMETALGNSSNSKPVDPENMQKATFGGGCFWCTEAVFQSMKGVHAVVSGYSGGKVDNPTYEEVCTGTTGHAEVIQIHYDPEVVTFDELLEVFWQTHDPTTLNRQGADVGTQYRSVVFYHDEEQKQTAEKYKQKLNETEAFGKPVVTEISPLETFYEAEDYHQDYYDKNPAAGYCRAVIAPKMDKFRKAFSDKLKK